ncbi:anti-sigma factor [Herbiconiux sp. CPCC 203407]|uniref:Regulator of SigK n=1 Tax=Herbiconiux oxytropis TaxID=2970915 RepID=A0AA41XAS7_9MICO|nr:anti-sigma factor [Herbiconiux oxytropis]MCS5721119.1 anti-sigma factor [Herbiconiux oxytropis]MCS5724771.1 anti-sigma factor [Herbiconiux oxytropis]
MSDRRDDNDPRELTGAYALDAVDTGEREAFERAAGRSENLQAEADELRETALLLALSADPVAPSERLKIDLMAKIASTPQEMPTRSESRPAESAPVDPQPQVAQSAEALPLAASSTPAELKASRRWFSGPIGLVAGVAAAAALFIGGGFVGGALSPDAPVVIDASATELAEITAASDSQRTTVELDGGTTATLVWSEELGRSAVVTDGLEPLPDDKVYEAWYIDSEGAVPAGTFTASGAGTAWHVLEGTMAAGATVGVTVEPAGGSETPTTDPVIVVESA